MLELVPRADELPAHAEELVVDEGDPFLGPILRQRKITGGKLWAISPKRPLLSLGHTKTCLAGFLPYNQGLPFVSRADARLPDSSM